VRDIALGACRERSPRGDGNRGYRDCQPAPATRIDEQELERDPQRDPESHHDTRDDDLLVIGFGALGEVAEYHHEGRNKRPQSYAQCEWVDMPNHGDHARQQCAAYKRTHCRWRLISRDRSGGSQSYREYNP